MDEKSAFLEVFHLFQQKYKDRGLEMVGRMVYMGGNPMFNTDGFNLLYNLKRLCAILEEELL